MVEKVYEIIDSIDENNIKKRLDEIKLKINNNEEIKQLIKKFEEAKKLYEKYNYKDDFIKSKLELLKNPVVKQYIELQNKINLISIKINNRIDKITKGVTEIK